MARWEKTNDRIFCEVCRKSGRIGEDIVPTGSGEWVHHGKCHRDLMNDRLPISSSVDRQLSRRHQASDNETTRSLFAFDDDGVENR